MKTLFALAFALVFVAGANAQNTATLDQTGTGNQANATQAGGATLNVTQGLNGNLVTATQDGISTATIVQSSTALPNSTGGHEATISQVGGDGNFIDFKQSFGTNNAGPKGAHKASLSQNGEDNRISGAADASEVDGYDPANQNSRSDLDAEVVQNGDRNVAEFSNGNPLNINQQGDDNFTQSNGGSNVDIDQIGNFNDVYNLGASGTFYQQGDQNEARAAGGYAGASHTVNFSQVGDYNVARANADPRGGNTKVDQDGDYNSAILDYGNPSSKDAQGVNFDIKQDAGAFGAVGASNVLEAQVRGLNNKAVISQTLTGAGSNMIQLNMLSDGGMANITQNGVGNSSVVTQN